MRSFKQYLLETVGHLPTVNVFVEIGTKISDANFKVLQFKISKYIKEEYKLTKFDITVKHSSTLLVTIYDIPQTLFQNTDFLGDIHDFVLDIYENPDDAYFSVECQWPPAFKIECESHLLIIKTNQASIKGIEKLVEGKSAAYQLNIRIEESVKSVGVLSLLKTSGFDSIIIDGSDEKYEKLRRVNDILNKHLHGDRNIMDFQEELMDNGLEEYAQL